MKTDYTEVTEVAGDYVTREQVERMLTRYSFAQSFSEGRDVLELGCGSGQGLGLLSSSARKVVGGEYSWPLLKMAKAHYRNTLPLIRLDAQLLPFKNRVFDVVILYEAIYYLKYPEKFAKECSRVLRPGGVVLLCNPNKDLPDFNPSPYSYLYFSPKEFVELLMPLGFEVECFGDCEVNYESLKQRLLAFVKKSMVRLNLMPKTMAGKKIFKRIVFGKLVSMPTELTGQEAVARMPVPIDPAVPDTCHKVIFAVGKKK